MPARDGIFPYRNRFESRRARHTFLMEPRPAAFPRLREGRRPTLGKPTANHPWIEVIGLAYRGRVGRHLHLLFESRAGRGTLRTTSQEKFPWPLRSYEALWLPRGRGDGPDRQYPLNRPMMSRTANCESTP